MLVAARDAGVKRLVYAGSSSAYGDTPTLPKREDMPTNPLSPYALQKLVGEQYLQLFTRLYGLETVTIRYFNVFGPRQDPSSPYSGVISLFATRVLEGRAPTIHGDGGQTRDFTYVANVVDGVLRACTAPGASGEVINVAVGGRISINELCATMASVLGSTVAPEHTPPRAGDVRDSQADITKARELLGYEPIVSFEEGLRRTLEWYKQEHELAAARRVGVPTGSARDQQLSPASDTPAEVGFAELLGNPGAAEAVWHRRVLHFERGEHPLAHAELHAAERVVAGVTLVDVLRRVRELRRLPEPVGPHAAADIRHEGVHRSEAIRRADGDRVDGDPSSIPSGKTSPSARRHAAPSS